MIENYNPNLMVIISGKDRGTDANKYSLTISLLSDNYIWVDETNDAIEIDWEIKQRVINVLDISDSKFNNNNHSILEALGLSSEDLKYLNLSITYNGTALSGYNWFNAGSYSVVLSINSAYNQTGNNVVFAGSTETAMTISFEVEKILVNVNGWNKDEENSTAKFDKDLISSDMVDYIVNKENITWSDGTTEDIEISWTITAKKIDLPKNDESFKVFDNQSHNLLEIFGVSDITKYLDILVTFNGDELFANTNGLFMATNAGSYSISFAIKSEFVGENISVCWSDDTTETKTFEFVVSKLTLNVDGWNEDKENSTIKSEGSDQPLQAILMFQEFLKQD